MYWPTPQYSRSQVTKAGQILISPSRSMRELVWAIRVLSNWRACHNYPVNTFQATLRAKLKKVDQGAIVAQRIKRMPSIVSKLQRFDQMNLARMQDIGGLRAVVGTLNKARQLEESYITGGRLKHKLVQLKDYIKFPKSSGYRSIHLVYKYKNPKADQYNDLLVELQIRTKLQHAWATSVETMGTFLEHSLKSSEGPEEWLQFFSLTGSAFALLESCPPVTEFEHLSKEETFIQTLQEYRRLGVQEKLSAYSIATRSIISDNSRGSYHLILLYPKEQKVAIRGYSQQRLDEANEEYMRVEKRIASGESIQAVLVSAGSISALKKAYPNYFLDTQAFFRHMKRIEDNVIGKNGKWLL